MLKLDCFFLMVVSVFMGLKFMGDCVNGLGDVLYDEFGLFMLEFDEVDGEFVVVGLFKLNCEFRLCEFRLRGLYVFE